MFCHTLTSLLTPSYQFSVQMVGKSFMYRFVSRAIHSNTKEQIKRVVQNTSPVENFQHHAKKDPEIGPLVFIVSAMVGIGGYTLYKKQHPSSPHHAPTKTKTLSVDNVPTSVEGTDTRLV